jgi:16S rRNA (cytosine967-C5)-methyltransferase
MLGTAGLIELRHFSPQVLVSALVGHVKAGRFPHEAGLVNAVLRRVGEEAPRVLEQLGSSADAKDQCLFWGIPSWAGRRWIEDWGKEEARKLWRLSSMKSYLSVRLNRPEKEQEFLAGLERAKIRGWPSPLLRESCRLSSNPFPPSLPGFAEGWVTPQTESAMLVVESFLELLDGGPVLEMCSGRGVKSGQILCRLPEGIPVESWELSPGKVAQAKAEMHRIGVSRRAVFKVGDARTLEPDRTPRAVLLDAPCSGSGTWKRHPESKWRLSPERLTQMASLQADLLKRAFSLVQPGGIVVYCTCSLFREENEQVVGSTLGSCGDLVELPLSFPGNISVRGKPYGRILWPKLPWVDGFYVAAFMKRA